MQGYQSKGALSSTGINFSFSSILTHSNLSPPFWRRVYCRGLGGQWPRKFQRGGGVAPMYAIYIYIFFFLINILLFLAKYKHFTAFYTYTNLSDDLQILSTVSYLET